MISVVDYPVVLERMRGEGFVCNYHNSGAFGFGRGVEVKVAGWVGPEDPTIRAEMRRWVRAVGEPYAANLAKLAREFWEKELGVAAWVMPMSHWAFELEFGSGRWMPGLLESVGIDVGMLRGRNDAAAIEVGMGEGEAFERLVRGLLEGLRGSDFMVAFPGRAVLCTVHHHKQLWWMGTGTFSIFDF